jgi:hypothetical protein
LKFKVDVQVRLDRIERLSIHQRLRQVSRLPARNLVRGHEEYVRVHWQEGHSGDNPVRPGTPVLETGHPQT